ncbi:MAG: hypothetical protein G01um1014107_132 [Parcubacteria group bacterium Gr01-1014_107]|nr:MAG: hypothetical protein G01um1014107_132 [Parcubacteria group bacterium Gr01-1014_107]
MVNSHFGPKSGKFLEVLGNYDSRQDKQAQFKVERIKHWLSQGAKTSSTVHNLLVSQRVIEAKKVNVLAAIKSEKKEEKGGEKSLTTESNAAEVGVKEEAQEAKSQAESASLS